MNTRGTRRKGTRGHDRGRGSARAGSSTSSHMPAREALASPITETRSHDRAAGDDSLSQVMLRDLERYEVEFLRLSQYAHGIITNEYERYVQFEDGLRDELHVLIAPQRERDFDTLVEKAKIAEDVKCSELQNREKDRGRNKRDFGPSSSSGRPMKRAKFDGSVQVVPVVSARPQPYADCKRVHQGRVAGNTEATQLALFYAAHRREDGDALDVITGMFLIYNVSYTALIDIGSTHSYVACTVSGMLGIQFENTVSEITVLSPVGQSVRVNKLFRGLPLEVQRVVFPVDLIELSFGEFDIILGMDWLVKYRVKLDCTAKHTVLKSTEDDEVNVIGEQRDYLSNVISALRAEKLVQKGCEMFLAYTSISNSKSPSAEDVRIVKEFSDVFPE
ncbi:uncharacterized protein LOC108466192 [Gossypium arboreum]|uniref:uncharacterized protein LOC108466192 n=1 Tax=Gossypium arboreum TaxID=29729 RepID=UPI000818FA4A|nr:uncharacterized protein LOC108466192 [Gossypium arboreum]